MKEPHGRKVARAIALVALVVAAVVVATLLLRDDGPAPYQVRAIFDNAANVIPGEDVKVAGVKVGAVSSLHVVSNRYAAVVLQVDDPGFQDFRRDAKCAVRLQSLIGEKFIDCTPTQPREAGTPEAKPLPVIPDGDPGAGQRLLTLAHTSSPIDPDLINNIMRAPNPDRFTVIINELGVGLAGRGQDLHDAIRRADPALKATDDVLKILADDNKTLDKLAADSAVALAPVARERAHVTRAIRASGATAEATAERRADLAQDLQLFPAFLREISPTMDRLGNLAAAGTPVVQNLGNAAPGLNQFSVGLKPLAEAAGPYFKSLGKTAKDGSVAVKDAEPAITALTNLANVAGPPIQKLALLLYYLDANDGIQNFLEFAFNGAAATNGYDSVSHYLRGALILSACSYYAVTVTDGNCSSNFFDLGGGASRRNAAELTSDAPRDAGLQRLAAVLSGTTPADALSQFPDPKAASTPVAANPDSGDPTASLADYLLAP